MVSSGPAEARPGWLARQQQTNHNNHAEIKLIKMRGPLARQGAFKNINKN